MKASVIRDTCMGQQLLGTPVWDNSYWGHLYGQQLLGTPVWTTFTRDTYTGQLLSRMYG